MISLATGPTLLLLYRLPSEPSAPRVAVWRALKRLPGGYLQDGVYALALTPANRLVLDRIAHDIRNNRGDASVIEVVNPDDERHLAARLRAAMEPAPEATTARPPLRGRARAPRR